MDEGDRLWQLRKPYDPAPGNQLFFQNLYTSVNLIEAMDVMPGGRILEIGCGPGWLSEILMLLGFEVDAVEPSEQMNEIAKARVSVASSHYRITDPPRVTFHCCPIEEAELEEGAYDGLLFYDSLHHVADEKEAVERSFRLLRDGGVLGISEGAWIPGDLVQARALEDEMMRFGTLENPLTQEYLDSLLEQAGFVKITRYSSINGFFPTDQEHQSIGRAAQQPSGKTNNLTAIKPSLIVGATTRDYRMMTRASITVLSELWDDDAGQVTLTARFVNTGETTWLPQPRLHGRGWVAIALRSGFPGSDSYLEAAQRHQLPQPVPPNGEATLDLSYDVPVGSKTRDWYLDLVNEGFFWFSERGTEAAKVGP
jgi:SAM-dependent methyltransferase